MRVVVLLGGESEEREVSLASGCNVADALRQAGHDVVALDSVGGALTREDEAKILAEGVGVLPPGTSGSAAASGHSGASDGAKLEDHEEIGSPGGVFGLEDVRGASADVVFPALHGARAEYVPLKLCSTSAVSHTREPACLAVASPWTRTSQSVSSGTPESRRRIGW